MRLLRSMRTSKLNWLDKTILALAQVGPSETTRYDIYPIKIGIAVSLSLNVLLTVGILKDLGVVGPLSLPIPIWTTVLLTMGLSYIPIHLTTHSAETIFSFELSRTEMWFFRALGFLLLGSSVLLGIWPIPALVNG